MATLFLLSANQETGLESITQLAERKDDPIGHLEERGGDHGKCHDRGEDTGATTCHLNGVSAGPISRQQGVGGALFAALLKNPPATTTGNIIEIACHAWANH